MADAIRRFILCGWHVASVIDLPELPLAPDDGGVADIDIVFGDVPEKLDDLVLDTRLVQLSAAGQARYFMPGIATFLIEQGRKVTIAAPLPRSAPDIRLFLLGHVFGLLCHQRDVFPLHAACVEIDGAAVAFAGGSGAGKSTLAMAFRRRGFRLLADDVAPLDLSTLRFLPGLRRIRLWPDSLHAAGWKPGELERCRDGLDKFSRVFQDGFVTGPIPPRALFHLDDVARGCGDLAFNRLQGPAALKQLFRQIYRWRSLRLLAGESGAVARAARVAQAIPLHFELRRRFGYDRLDATIDAILDVLRTNR